MIRKNLQHINIKSSEYVDKTINKICMEESEAAETLKNYTARDLENLEHQEFAAGFAPYLRGISSSMYLTKPWGFAMNKIICSINTNGQLNDNRTPQDTEQKKAAITFLQSEKAFTLTSNPEPKIVNSVDSFEKLLKSIPVNDVSTVIHLNKSSQPILAFYMAAMSGKDFELNATTTTLKIDNLDELLSQTNTENLSSKKLAKEITQSLLANKAQVFTIEISGVEMRNTGATITDEIAHTMALAVDYIRDFVKSGVKIDQIAPRLTFEWSVGPNYFIEIAKLRAARMVWAKLLQEFEPKNEQSLQLKVISRPITSPDTLDNFAKSTIQASAAILGGTQHLSLINSKSDASIVEKINQFLLNETKISKTVDPWAGSYHIENLTHELAHNLWNLIEDIDLNRESSKVVWR